MQIREASRAVRQGGRGILLLEKVRSNPEADPRGWGFGFGFDSRASIEGREWREACAWEDRRRRGGGGF